MFGKPHWFRKKKSGWGLTPITTQGRVYMLIWIAVLVLPFSLLLVREQPVEALVWVAAAGGFLLYDVRHIMAAMHPAVPDEDLLYIGDDEGSADRLATRNYDFQLRR